MALVCAFVFFTTRPSTQMAVVAPAGILLLALELQHHHKPYAPLAPPGQRACVRSVDDRLKADDAPPQPRGHRAVSDRRVMAVHETIMMSFRTPTQCTHPADRHDRSCSAAGP